MCCAWGLAAMLLWLHICLHAVSWLASWLHMLLHSFDGLTWRVGSRAECVLKPSTQVFECLKDARSAGCKTVSGVEMFIGQAAEQFELFTSQRAPVDLMRQVVFKSLSQ